MCERKEKCQEGEEDESDSDDEGQFDVDHFDSVNRNRNGIERGSSDTGGADSLSYYLWQSQEGQSIIWGGAGD